MGLRPRTTMCLARPSPLPIVRINDIVNTVAAYQALAQLQGRRVGQSAPTGGDLGFDLASQAQIAPADLAQQISSTDDSSLGGSDGLALSPAARAAAGDVAPAQDDDSLGAIIDRFVRQRSVMNIAFPIATGNGGAGLFSLSVELDEAYRVIEFVPRSEWTA